jgi:WD40 repeat protein
MVRRTLLLIGLFATGAAVPPAATAPPAARTDLLGDPLPDGALARVGTPRFRHGATVVSVAYTPDGKSVATGGLDGVVRVWDAATGRQRLRIPTDGALLPLDEDSEDPHALPIAYSPDGRRLATPGPDHAVVLREAATGRAVRTLCGPGKPVVALAFAPDGQTLFAMDQGQAVRAWDADGQERLNIAGRRTRGAAFALAPDGKTIATGGEDGGRLWDAARRTELDRLPGVPRVHSVAFSPDGGTLAVGDGGGSVHLWDRGGGRMRDVFHVGGVGRAEHVAFSPDGKTLARVGDEVDLCEAASGKETARFEGQAAAFAPDGRTLAVAHGPGLGLVDARTGRERPTDAGHTGPLRALAFTPDGKTLATAALDRSVRFWDAATGKETTGTRGQAVHASSLAFAPDGRRLVAGASLSGTIHANYLTCVWDAATGRAQPLRFPGHSETVHRTLFAADGKTFFTASAAGDVAVWDPVTGKELRRFKDANRRVYDLALSPDGKTLAAGGHAYVRGREQQQEVEGAVRLLDAATGQEHMTLRTHDKAVLGVGFLRDGRTLVSLGTNEPVVVFSGVRLGLGADPPPASAGGEPVVLWELATGLPRLRLLSGRDGVWRLAVSPDGRLAALGCHDGSVRIWDLLAGRERRRFDGHIGAVTALAFSPDGRVLASGGGDTTVLLWDMSAVPPAPPAGAPDGAMLAALWADLADEPPAAYRAIGRLAAAPREAVPFLGARVRPAAAPDAATVARLLADLDNDSFAERERATTELRRLGDRAGPALRQFLLGAPAPEGRRRAQALVADLERDLVPREQLRDLRAVEALEWAGATDVLRKLAAGMPEARLTREAKAALLRLGEMKPGG